MNNIRVYGLTCVFLLASMAAHATTIVLPSDEQLIAKTPVIVDGTVLSTTAVDRDGTIWTDTVVEVARALKGDVADAITIREIGGAIDERITKLYGAPEFTAGERVLLFLDESPRGGYRTVDLYVGKFSEGAMQNGRRLWTRNDVSHDVNLLDANLQPLNTKNVQRDAIGFEAFVRARIEGRVGVKNYGIENPMIRRGITSEFTLISEPTIYRWFAFANGQTAQWYSAGTQPGYSNGGVSELQTAMQAWTSYSAANINYSYVGSRTGALGGLSGPNGVNEVLFSDPLNEITGTYNRNTGGVVGTGGFNGVTSRQNWVATFAADATHPAGMLQAWNIVEGNLTIQDGVTAANGISSKILAEIVSHEFGHTLGFGHSLDGGALMYSSVTGGGPSLKNDDQIAARWLYPNGGTTPPPPPSPTVPSAPSDLRAIVSGSNIDVSWFDNANNETGFAVYLATGNGAFSKKAEVGANVKSTRLSGLSSGTYRVYAIALNATGNSGQSNTASAIIAAAPNAAFSMTPQSGTAGVTSFTFYDESTGGVSSRSWDFGDGGSSTSMVATHVYATSGTYTVTLTVFSADGKSSTTAKTINVTGGAITPYRALVSVATYGGGIGGTAWRTELNLFNAGLQGANVSLIFLPTAGGSVRSRSLFLAPRQLSTYANALVDLFGIASGAGALTIEATSAGTNADLRVSSRTFTTGTIGTYGQAVPDVQSEGLEKTLYITGMATNASFRTNVGLVNRGGVATNATLTLYSRTGSVLSTKSVSIPGNSFQQASLASFFPEVSGASHEVLTMRIVSASSDVISAYASRIDNLTQDPVYLQARASETGGTLTIPVVGRAPGANGTFWRSDVTLYNPTSSSMSLTLRYAGATQSLSLGGNDTRVLADVLAQFGHTSSSGAMQVTWSASTGPVVTSSTYTSVVSGGTYGQSIDPVADFTRRAFVPGLRHDGSYRSNIGFVNGGSETEVFTVMLLSPSGTELARNSVTLTPGQQMQTSVVALFPGASLPNGFTLQAEGDGNAKLFAYGSMVDNKSGDPVFFAGR
ncbi:MAG TPA: PKD domain-containing protein [Thermoanaerobaculia bacterium]|nr:PKD domain-containing protein [Thermoanaerobaculia bacterium]